MRNEVPIETRKKEGENTGAFLFRFSKRVKQGGIVKEVKKRRFKHRAENKRKRRLGALYRVAKEKEVVEKRKLGRM